MGRLKKVVFDLDGTLNNLNDVVKEEVGILHNWRYYDISKNTDVMSAEQIKLVALCYRDLELFKKVSLLEDAREIIELNKRCEVVIHSLSFTEEIADFKRIQLKSELGLKDSQIILPVGPHKVMMECDVMVEDCLHNAVNSVSDVTYLIAKSYNIFGSYNYMEEELKNIIRVEALKHATKGIGELIKC